MTGDQGKDAPGGVSASPWHDRSRALKRRFPGPPDAQAALRVSFARSAYGDVTAHAKESLEAEVCGVLVGDLCEDEAGPFLDVQNVLRGSAARAARGHVTFTQETWNGIHAALERDHPKKAILGWYHTHPGFGVEFSEMDTFIQSHFFPLSSQVALVTDPLGGDVALAQSSPAGLRYLDRFWVDGREHRARVPAAASATPRDPAGAEAALEVRVSQLVAAVQELRTTLHRVVALAAAALAVALASVVGYAIHRTFVASVKPPESIAWVPVPITLDGKPVLIGLGVLKWQIPEELLAPAEPAADPSAAVPAPSPPSAPPSSEAAPR